MQQEWIVGCLVCCFYTNDPTENSREPRVVRRRILAHDVGVAKTLVQYLLKGSATPRDVQNLAELFFVTQPPE